MQPEELKKLAEHVAPMIEAVLMGETHVAVKQPEAPKASEAAHCAAEQKKYWEMHDAMFANQRALQVPVLKQTARTIGLNGEAFDQCLDSGKYAATVQGGKELGERMGVNSTPTLYINGRALIGAVPFENFKAIIDEELARK